MNNQYYILTSNKSIPLEDYVNSVLNFNTKNNKLIKFIILEHLKKEFESCILRIMEKEKIDNIIELALMQYGFFREAKLFIIKKL